jgi:hypothetical protein
MGMRNAEFGLLIDEGGAPLYTEVRNEGRFRVQALAGDCREWEQAKA